jgi:large subunit ribosomal protein L32
MDILDLELNSPAGWVMICLTLFPEPAIICPLVWKIRRAYARHVFVIRRTYYMPPHPKRKHSKGRRDRRRAHDALQPRHLLACSNCGSKRLPHTVCPNCGFYDGREIVEVKSEKKAA